MKTKVTDYKKELIEKIKTFFIKNQKTKYNHKQLSKRLPDLQEKDRKYVNGILYLLAKEGFIIEVYKGKFVLNPKESIKLKTMGTLCNRYRRYETNR